VIFNLQFVSFAIYPSGYLLGSLLGDSSENLERVVWCGEGSIAMGLVENMNPAPEQTPTPKESDRT
jgi:hypothetical protein